MIYKRTNALMEIIDEVVEDALGNKHGVFTTVQLLALIDPYWRRERLLTDSVINSYRVGKAMSRRGARPWHTNRQRGWII